MDSHDMIIGRLVSLRRWQQGDLLSLLRIADNPRIHRRACLPLLLDPREVALLSVGWNLLAGDCLTDEPFQPGIGSRLAGMLVVSGSGCHGQSLRSAASRPSARLSRVRAALREMPSTSPISSLDSSAL